TVPEQQPAAVLAVSHEVTQVRIGRILEDCIRRGAHGREIPNDIPLRKIEGWVIELHAAEVLEPDALREGDSPLLESWDRRELRSTGHTKDRRPTARVALRSVETPKRVDLRRRQTFV